MADPGQVWQEALPDIRKGVTGVGVWAALNACKFVAWEDGQFVLGLEPRDTELAGHLRLPQTKRLIETELARRMDAPVIARIIEGTSTQDWDTEKRRDAEKRRLQEQALARAKQELTARNSWESIYDQLSRKFAAIQNRSLPQNRARFYMEAVDIVSEALRETPVTDDLAERNFARCLERISQYTEIPSAIVAAKVLEKTFEG